MQSPTSQDILQWLQNPTNQLIVIAAGAVLLLLVIWLLVRRRRRGGEREVIANLPATSDSLQNVFESYRLSHPAFYSLVKSVQERHLLDNFSENKEFTGAVAKLRLIQAARRTSSQATPKAATLRLEPYRGDTSREVRAAMMTILRLLYASAEVRATLESQQEAELDRLVESLTD